MDTPCEGKGETRDSDTNEHERETNRDEMKDQIGSKIEDNDLLKDNATGNEEKGTPKKESNKLPISMFF